MWKLTFLVLPVCILSACGGGSGSGASAPTSIDGFSELPENGTVTLSGSGRSVKNSSDPSGNVEYMLLDPGEANVRVTRENGQIKRLTFSGPGGSSTVDCDASNDQCGSRNGLLFETGGTQGAIAVIPSPDDFEYQSFGIWYNGYVTDGTTGVVSVGFPTENPNRIPQKAVYKGGALGTTNIRGKEEIVTSSVKISTDMSRVDFRTVDSKATDWNGNVRDADELNLNGALHRTGTGAFGQVRSWPPNVTNMSGLASATFHGPNGEEIGGTFSVTGSTPGQGYGTYIGAFGAKR